MHAVCLVKHLLPLVNTYLGTAIIANKRKQYKKSTVHVHIVSSDEITRHVVINWPIRQHIVAVKCSYYLCRITDVIYQKRYHGCKVGGTEVGLRTIALSGRVGGLGEG